MSPIRPGKPAPARTLLCTLIAASLWGSAASAAHAAEAGAAAAALSGPSADAASPLQANAPYAIPQGELRAGAPVSMVLSVSLNQTRLQELLLVQRNADGSFNASAGDLRKLRLRIDPRIPDLAMVQLATIPGLVAEYDEAQQSLALRVDDAQIQPFDVELGGETARTDLSDLQTLPAGILNYDLTQIRQEGRNSTYGSLEGLWTGRHGIVSTTATYSNGLQDTYQQSHLVRLDSAWQYIDPRSVRSYILGDFTSNALSWSSSVRMAGVQIASDFSQRADIVTAALPQFSGSAALPSTLDLYVNQQKVYSGEVPSGPYQLKSLPYISGNDVTLVMTDASGRQTTSTQAFYYNAQILKQGLSQYSLDIGVPRFNYGLRSDDYDNTVFGAGSLRYGWLRGTTVESHLEFSGDGLGNAGVGVAQDLWGRGTVSASWASSHYKGHDGSLGAFSLEGQVLGMRLFGSMQRTYGDYFDLARVSSARYLRRDLSTSSPLDASALASAVDRLGASFTPWFDSTSISLSYNRIRYLDDDRRTANLSLSRSVTSRVSIYANAYTNLGGERDHGVYVMFNINLDRNIHAAVGVQKVNGQLAYTQQVNGNNGARQGGTSWGLASTQSEGASDQYNAYVSYLSRVARLSARYYGVSGQNRTEVEAAGSLMLAGGDVFAANQIGDAYALIKHAGPGAEVLQGGVRMGRANRNGNLLLPNIPAYYEQKIFIDPAGLPDGWELAETEKTVVAGYRQGAVVDFGAAAVHGAVVILHDAQGKPLAPGYVVTLSDGSTGMVGYDGQTYLRGLQRQNRVTVDRGSAGRCVADFTYDPDGPAQPTLGPVTCQ